MDRPNLTAKKDDWIAYADHLELQVDAGTKLRLQLEDQVASLTLTKPGDVSDPEAYEAAKHAGTIAEIIPPGDLARIAGAPKSGVGRIAELEGELATEKARGEQLARQLETIRRRKR